MKPQERNRYFQSMIMNFRKQTLSLDDHRQLSEWIQENEQNEKWFESWILQPVSSTPNRLNVVQDNPVVKMEPKIPVYLKVAVIILTVLLVSLLVYVAIA